MDHVNLEPNEISKEFPGGFRASLCPAILDRNIATFEPSEFARPAQKWSSSGVFSSRPAEAQKADGQQLSWLLCPRRQRPNHSAAKPRDELPPFHGQSSRFKIGAVTKH
jgi:hypothetical protein